MVARDVRPILERLNERVEIVAESGCWIWMGAATDKGYGMLRVNGGQQYAHRLMAGEILGDVIGKVVCHRCDVPYCINPDHLFIGTYQDNSRDMVAKGRNHDASGENHGSAKLTEADVLSIRNSHERGVVLAERFGVCQSAISNIRNRKRWRHL